LDTQPVLNPGQLRRIEAIHRGWLYQHLFAVACLLRRTRDLIAVSVERDEDVELILADGRIYVQVKKRATALEIKDVETALTRFEEIQSAHASGARQGFCEFWIVSNAEPSPELRPELNSRNINAHFPGGVIRSAGDRWPGPWATIDDALAECDAAAQEIPLANLEPRTLVWKLAAIVAAASAGEDDRESHEIRMAELADISEQFAEQLHFLPLPPENYRAQEHEPVLGGNERALLIVAHSGGGKTAWVAEGASHSDRPLIYFDVGGLPDASVAPSFLRELLAQLSSRMSIDKSRTLRAGSAALEGLRGVNEIIRRGENIRPIAVLDNAHRAEPATIKDLVDATPALRWVLLAQPTRQRTLLEALTKLAATNLDGWSFDTIIEECDDAGTRIDLETSRRVKRLTGGLPLFVKNISAVAQRSYSGRVSALCDEIEAATTLEELAQDAILGKVVAEISEMARKAASLMLLSPFPLTVAEFRTVLADGLAISEAQVTEMLKELRKWGVTQPRFDGSTGLHDAFRTVRFTSESECSPDVIRRAMESLLGLLKESFGPGKLDRLVLFCRLMVDLGNGSEVPGILSNVAEHLYDLGRAKELMGLLAQLAGDQRLSIDDRFLAADTAAFWSMCANDDAATERFLAIMQELIDQGISDPEALSRFAMKQMPIAAERRDYAGVESAFKTAKAYAQGDSIIFRVLRYTYAVAQFKLERFRAASDIAKELVTEYGEVLGISVARDLRGTLLPHIIAALGPNIEEIDEIKRFADCFDLRARSLQELKEPYTNMFLYAHKLYVLSNSPSSAVKAGMDFVFSLVESNAVDVAKTFMENMLIPLVESHQLLENMIPIQSEYAVVLAYCGEVDKAKSVINQLRKISIDRPDVEAEFRYRVNLVDDIERRGLRPRAMHCVGGNPLLPATAPINRNSPCACGSGLKYKKCCGSASAG
jgi:hypothetical protein